MRWTTCWLVVFCAAAFGLDAQPHHAKTGSNSGSRTAWKSVALPVTTQSSAARQTFEHAMVDLEALRRSDALNDLRASVKRDPKFAQAYILISDLTHDPEEQSSCRVRAEQLASRVSPGERLLIRWLSGVQENNYVPAIAAMNDLLAMY